MNLSRRSLLSGLIAAPAVILTPGLLMPVKAWADEPWISVINGRRWGPEYEAWSLVIEGRTLTDGGLLYVSHRNVETTDLTFFEAPFTGVFTAAIWHDGEKVAAYKPEAIIAGNSLCLPVPAQGVRA
jgi:hypothetical protein